MPHYCDSAVLEKNWFNWLMAAPTPALEQYRTRGTLLSRVIAAPTPAPRGGGKFDEFWGFVRYPVRAHCVVATDGPVYFFSYNGKPTRPRRVAGTKHVNCDMPGLDQCAKLDPKIGSPVADGLVAKGYILETPAAASWHAIQADIYRMCEGISRKYNIQSDEDRADLIGDAFVEVIKKIRNKQLVYTPGRAPVFNLLTTTIHRIICSVLNRRIRDRNNATKYAGLVTPHMGAHPHRSGGRTVTRRVFGSLVACAN